MIVRPWIVATPMFNKVHFWKHWLRFLIPAATEKSVSSALIEGIKARRVSVTVPNVLRLWMFIYSFVPFSARHFLLKNFGGYELLNAID